MRLYLKRWGFTIQRPKTRAFTRNESLISSWPKEAYKIIKDRAKKENAEIHWLDETGVNNQCFYHRGFSKKGQTPIVKNSPYRTSISVISSVNNQGKMRFMTYKGSLKADGFLKFLNLLIKDSKHKIFLIADNLPTHKAKKVIEFLDQDHVKNKLELHYLPPYAPELNPDEYLNNDLKQNVHKKLLPKNYSEVEYNTRAYLRSIQKQPQKVKSFFQTEFTRYAA
jgi:transposase